MGGGPTWKLTLGQHATRIQLLDKYEDPVLHMRFDASYTYIVGLFCSILLLIGYLCSSGVEQHNVTQLSHGPHNILVMGSKIWIAF